MSCGALKIQALLRRHSSQVFVAPMAFHVLAARLKNLPKPNLTTAANPSSAVRSCGRCRDMMSGTCIRSNVTASRSIPQHVLHAMLSSVAVLKNIVEINLDASSQHSSPCSALSFYGHEFVCYLHLVCGMEFQLQCSACNLQCKIKSAQVCKLSPFKGKCC